MAVQSQFLPTVEQCEVNIFDILSRTSAIYNIAFQRRWTKSITENVKFFKVIGQLFSEHLYNVLFYCVAFDIDFCKDVANFHGHDNFFRLQRNFRSTNSTSNTWVSRFSLRHRRAFTDTDFIDIHFLVTKTNHPGLFSQNRFVVYVIQKFIRLRRIKLPRCSESVSGDYCFLD